MTPPEVPVVLPNQGAEPTPELDKLDKARANAASELEKLDEELRLDLERSRAEEAERVDRDKLVPVGPRGSGPGLRPVVPDTARQLGSDPIAVDHEGQCKLATGRSDWSSAISSCSLAMQSNARDMNSQVRYGIALFETGNSDDAGVQLAKAKSLGSRDARIEKYLGHIAKKQGDVFGANAHYQAYLATKPRDAAAIQALMQGG
jgi:predicted Zn-dependent protease